jgi:hypothetical protein
MVGEFYFLPFRPLIPFALMGFASGSDDFKFEKPCNLVIIIALTNTNLD